VVLERSLYEWKKSGVVVMNEEENELGMCKMRNLDHCTVLQGDERLQVLSNVVQTGSFRVYFSI
jgi:hypothetical protein